ncbi:MAG: nucleoside-diphosphate-sugar epimerase [Rhodospirillales bacterium 69-11]|nr:NAD-dependent epimerase/dehydratase family protein [Rhodospirillales bacterium]OJW27120.1 MAG: nucleoside-diphosphate-sugar epimerase [Rhodospirillales bacterium 69-11]
MAAERILITGGAGFIGCHLTKALLDRGHTVRVLDSLIDQVHGGREPNPILQHVELVEGDIRDPAAVASALQGVDAVVHLAAEVGVGQSMYAVERYVGANDLGTAVLLEALLAKPVRRLVVASSMSIYGEGLYRDQDGATIEDAVRGDRKQTGTWDPVDAQGRPLVPVPTTEAKRPSLASVYAITKFVQERMVLTVAPAYGMEAAALRLFNVYGPGQALSNPYTGVLAIFAAMLLNGNGPQVFEDGAQRRDFVHVEDVARAFVLALERPEAVGQVFNIGSGQAVTIRQVAEELATAMGRRDIRPVLLGKARTGDIRHCFADIGAAQATLGFAPERNFGNSLAELAEWVRGQQTVDRVAEARRELEVRGLVA